MTVLVTKDFLELMPGIEIILNKMDIHSNLNQVDLMITGEGKIDSQSRMGKVLSGIGKLGLDHNIPVIALAGSVSDDAYSLNELGITAIFSMMNYPMTLKDAMNKDNTIFLLKNNTSQIIRLFTYR